MRRIILILSIVFFSPHLSLYSQTDRFTIVFYNVENLFDTINSPDIEDMEFTPDGSKKWNSERYYKKLNDLSGVLGSITPGDLPEIIGLAEVENYAVLSDLVKTPPLSAGNYGIVHEEGHDPRGIETAFLYRKDRFKNIRHKSIEVIFPFDSTSRGRNILYVSGMAPDGKEIHFYVNHWSSRFGGTRETERKRMFSAVALRRNIDMVLTRNSSGRIVIMGDMNDEPTNQSVMNVLLAANKRKNVSPADLYNLFYDAHNINGDGSYFYQENWNMLDHIIVSYNLINQKAYYSCDYDSGRIFMNDLILYENVKGNKIPNRTYSGNIYTGGASDHLPVYVTLTR